MSLQKLYYDVKQPSSFSGENKLKKVYKGKDNVQKWLNNHYTHHYVKTLIEDLHMLIMLIIFGKLI